MARPLSEEKREAILSAATGIVASRGTEASTSQIAKAAGVAEGTVFTYFSTKDALLNALYLSIKRDVAKAVLDGAALHFEVTKALQTIWDNYLSWGLGHPSERRAISQLAVSGRLTEKTREIGSNAFSEVDALLDTLTSDAFEGTQAFASAIMSALAETTIEFMLAHPRDAQSFRDNGFKILMRALSGHS